MTDGLDRLATSAGTLILVEEAARTASGESRAVTGLGGVTALPVEVDVTEVSGMTLVVNPRTNKEEELAPGLIVVVEETLDGTNWKEIVRHPPPRRADQPANLITDVSRETITLGGPLAETIRFRWIIRASDFRNPDTGKLETGKLISPLFRFSVTSPPCQPGA
jgi:hypothetical protein